MKEHTDLEKKLFDYILYLMAINNVYAVSMNELYKYLAEVHHWVGENMAQLGDKEKYDTMLEHLNQEFSWNFKSHDARDES